MLQVTNTHQAMSQWLLFEKNFGLFKTYRLQYLYHFHSIKIRERLKVHVTCMDVTTTNGDRLTYLINSFLQMYRYRQLNVEINGYFDGSFKCQESLPVFIIANLAANKVVANYTPSKFLVIVNKPFCLLQQHLAIDYYGDKITHHIIY